MCFVVLLFDFADCINNYSFSSCFFKFPLISVGGAAQAKLPALSKAIIAPQNMLMEGKDDEKDENRSQ